MPGIIPDSRTPKSAIPIHGKPPMLTLVAGGKIDRPDLRLVTADGMYAVERLVRVGWWPFRIWWGRWEWRIITPPTFQRHHAEAQLRGICAETRPPRNWRVVSE